MDPKAQRHLAARLEIARTWRAGAPSDDLGEGTGLVTAYHGALEALRAVGAISGAEYDEWSRRMAEELEVPRPDLSGRAARASGERAHVAGIVEEDDGGDAPSPEDRDRVTAAEFGALVRVVRGPIDVIEIAGGTYRLLLVEIHEYGIEILWRLLPLPDPDELFPEEVTRRRRDMDGLQTGARHEHHRDHRLSFLAMAHHIEDDVGTAYQLQSAGSSGDSGLTGATRFAPGGAGDCNGAPRVLAWRPPRRRPRRP